MKVVKNKHERLRLNAQKTSFKHIKAKFDFFKSKPKLGLLFTQSRNVTQIFPFQSGKLCVIYINYKDYFKIKINNYNA